MKCIKKTDVEQCEEKERECNEMDANKCSDFTPKTSTMKCQKKADEDQCEEKERECNEMAANKCSDFTCGCRSTGTTDLIGIAIIGIALNCSSTHS